MNAFGGVKVHPCGALLAPNQRGIILACAIKLQRGFPHVTLSYCVVAAMTEGLLE